MVGSSPARAEDHAPHLPTPCTWSRRPSLCRALTRESSTRQRRFHRLWKRLPRLCCHMRQLCHAGSISRVGMQALDRQDPSCYNVVDNGSLYPLRWGRTSTQFTDRASFLVALWPAIHEQATRFPCPGTPSNSAHRRLPGSRRSQPSRVCAIRHPCCSLGPAPSDISLYFLLV